MFYLNTAFDIESLA